MGISEQILTIVENTPGVIENVKASQSTATGTTVAVDDVNPILHEIGCKLTSKNLFDISNVQSVYDNAANIEVIDNVLRVSKVTADQWVYNLIKVGNVNDFNGKTLCFSGKHSREANQVHLIFGYADADGNNRVGGIVWDKSSSTFSLALTVDGITYANKILVVWFYVDTSQVGQVGDYTDFTDLQLELGDTPTPYTPYTTDFSGIEVSRYDKNLFEFKQGIINNGEILEELENGAVLQGVKYDDRQWNSWGNGWYDFFKRSTISLKAGDIVTLSCDYTLLELAEGRTDATDSLEINKKVGMFVNNYTANSLHLYPANQPKLGQTIRCYVTGTIKEDGDYCPTFTINSNKVRIENIQIELGDTPTAYQPYTEPQYAFAEQDGTVRGLTTVSPGMTLTTNNPGVVINARYFDSNNNQMCSKYTELKQAQKSASDLFKEE